MMVVPVSFEDARKFINHYHRHLPAPPGGKFVVGVANEDTGDLVGVAWVGRPVARHFDDGWTLEVNRTCVVPEAKNANSMLYGTCWQVAKHLGYLRLITYTLASESGSSLRGAGWKVIAERQSRPGWSRPQRPRDPGALDNQTKLLWEVCAK